MYTINAVGQDGKTYALYFECADIVDAENIVRQVGLLPDDAGVCEMVTMTGKKMQEAYYGGAGDE